MYCNRERVAWKGVIASLSIYAPPVGPLQSPCVLIDVDEIGLQAIVA